MTMMYTLQREELLELARRVFEASVDNYMDLRDQTCDHVLEAFLADKKTLPNTNLSLGSLGFSGAGTQVVTLSHVGPNIIRPNDRPDPPPGNGVWPQVGIGNEHFSLWSNQVFHVTDGNITQGTLNVQTS